MTVDEPRLRQLMQVFLAENRKLNLSAFRTEEHCWTGNILDSLALLEIESALFGSMQRLLDIGTGGGFPLLPLALCLPRVSCVGVDAVRKKVDSVQRIVAALGLKNVELRCGRVEELGHDAGLRASFDLVTARAVAPLPVLLEYAVPFLKVGGICAFWKSIRIAQELASSARAQELLGAPYLRSHTYDLGEGWGKRTIVLFRKARATAETYPRRTGLPKAKPL